MAVPDLINSIISGDERAFKTIVDSNAAMIFRVIMNFGVSREDAEDLSQEVFIEVYRNIKKFRNESEISTWLYRIAINKSINFVKKSKRFKWAKNSDDDISDTGKMIAVESSEANFVNNEQRILLYNSLGKLPKNQRIAFTLNKLDDLSYKEISGIMNISVSSVESLMHRAKINLQKSLSKNFEITSPK